MPKKVTTKTVDEAIISEAMSLLASKSHKKSPRSKEFMKHIQKKSAAQRKRNRLKKLSTGKLAT